MISEEGGAGSPRRNDSCSCGSRKRYKECCGSLYFKVVSASGRSSTEFTPNSTTASAAGLDEMMRYAMAQHQAGRLLEAEVLYQRILRLESANAMAVHYSGVVQMQLGRVQQAERLLRRSLELRTDIPDFHNNLGVCLRARGDLEEAVTYYRQALVIQPDYLEALQNLYLDLQQLGRNDEALQCVDELKRLRPDFSPLFSPSVAADHFRDWEERNYAAPCPPVVKQQVILRNGLGNATWIETGTYLGETTEVISKVAKMVYSIEPEPALYSRALGRFSNATNVRIINGLSEHVLPELLPTLSGDMCFWLDGHYSAGMTFKGPKDTPIVDELGFIERHLARMGKVIVMVDDVRCFNPRLPDYAAYPPLDFLVDWARGNDMDWHIEHDIFFSRKA